MRYVVADAGQRVDHGFHLIEHAVDNSCKPGKRLVDIPMWKTFAEIAGDNALNALIDLLDTPLRAQAEPRAGQQAKTKCREQTKHERLAHHMRDFSGLV